MLGMTMKYFVGSSGLPWAMLRPVGGRIDDGVRFLGVERAIGLVGELGAAVGQAGLQDDVARLEDLVIGHNLSAV
jgi:hypothetical protein